MMTGNGLEEPLDRQHQTASSFLSHNPYQYVETRFMRDLKVAVMGIQTMPHYHEARFQEVGTTLTLKVKTEQL